MICNNKIFHGCGKQIELDEHQLVQSIKPSTAPVCYDCFKTQIISLCDKCGKNVYGVDRALYTYCLNFENLCSDCFNSHYNHPCPKHPLNIVRGCDIINRLELYGLFYNKCDLCYNRDYVAYCKCGIHITGSEVDCFSSTLEISRVYNKYLAKKRCIKCAARRLIEEKKEY